MTLNAEGNQKDGDSRFTLLSRYLTVEQALTAAEKARPIGYVVNQDLRRGDHEKEMFEPLKLRMGVLADNQRHFCRGGWIELTDEDKDKTCLVLTRPQEKRKSKSSFIFPPWSYDHYRRFDKPQLQSHIIEFPSIVDVNVESLIKNCSQAPFGDLERKETVVDADVRQAWECPGHFSLLQDKEDSRFGYGGKTILFLCSIRDHFMEKMAYKSYYVSFVPHKVNVYGPGGFFKQHKDTPYDPQGMIGSVVICLPSPHKGGELKVTHGETVQVFDFSPLSGDQTRIQWAAFYSDCLHEVLPVTEGYRITVTYNVVASHRMNRDVPGIDTFCCFSRSSLSKSERVDEIQTAMTEDEAVESVVKCLGDLQTSKADIRHIGLILSHQYTMLNLAAGLLKGTDKLLYDALVKSYQWHVTMLTILIHRYTDVHAYEPFEMEMDYGDVWEVIPFSEVDFKYLTGNGPSPDRRLPNRIPFVSDDVSKPLLLREHSTSRVYWSNEYEPGAVYLYLQGALILSLK